VVADLHEVMEWIVKGIPGRFALDIGVSDFIHLEKTPGVSPLDNSLTPATGN
jgi:hypothetical protein